MILCSDIIHFHKTTIRKEGAIITWRLPFFISVKQNQI